MAVNPSAYLISQILANSQRKADVTCAVCHQQLPKLDLGKPSPRSSPTPSARPTSPAPSATSSFPSSTSILANSQRKADVTCAVCHQQLPKLDLDKHVRRDHLNYRPFACGLCADAGAPTHFYTRDDIAMHARRAHNHATAYIVEDLESMKEAAFEKMTAESLKSLGKEVVAAKHRYTPLTPASPGPPPLRHAITTPVSRASRTPVTSPPSDSDFSSTPNPRPIYTGLDTSSAAAPSPAADDSGYLSHDTPQSEEKSKWQLLKIARTCSLCSAEFTQKRRRKEHALEHARLENAEFDAENFQELVKAHQKCFPKMKYDFPVNSGGGRESVVRVPAYRGPMVCGECGKTSSYDHRGDHIVRHHWDVAALACNLCDFKTKWVISRVKEHLIGKHGPQHENDYTDRRSELRAELAVKVRELFSPPGDRSPSQDAPEEEEEGEEDEGEEPTSKRRLAMCEACHSPVAMDDLPSHVWLHLAGDGSPRYVCGCGFKTGDGKERVEHARSSHGGRDEFRDDKDALLPAFRLASTHSFPNFTVK